MIKREELENVQLKAKADADSWRDGEVSSLVEEHERIIDNGILSMRSEYVVRMSQIESEDPSIRKAVLEKIKSRYVDGGWTVSSERRHVGDPSRPNHTEPCIVLKRR